jgi:hypothetical protein
VDQVDKLCNLPMPYDLHNYYLHINIYVFKFSNFKYEEVQYKLRLGGSYMLYGTFSNGVFANQEVYSL